MTFKSLLPPSIAIDPKYVLLEQLAARWQDIDLTPVLTMMVDTVKPDVLPILAEQFSLFGDGWDLAVTEEARRDLIKHAIEIHRHKGTPWSIKRVLAILGYGDGVISENPTQDAAKWYEYSIDFSRPITIAEGKLIRGMLLNIAPARCVLVAVDFTHAPYTYDGQYKHDATISYGVA